MLLVHQMCSYIKLLPEPFLIADWCRFYTSLKTLFPRTLEADIEASDCRFREPPELLASCRGAWRYAMSDCRSKPRSKHILVYNPWYNSNRNCVDVARGKDVSYCLRHQRSRTRGWDRTCPGGRHRRIRPNL